MTREKIQNNKEQEFGLNFYNEILDGNGDFVNILLAISDKNGPRVKSLLQSYSVDVFWSSKSRHIF